MKKTQKMRSSKKRFGQSSLEFVLITSFMFFIFMGSVMVIQGRISGAQKTRVYTSLEGLANVVRTEVRMAHSVQGDYSRKFSLPWILEGYNYSISLYNKTEIIIRIADFDYVVFLDQNITGNISQGRNLIKKEDGNISIISIELKGPSELCEGGAGTDDEDCGEIDCSGWYNKTGIQGAYASDVQSCYNKENLTDEDDRCEGVGECKDANTDDCDEQDDYEELYSCGECQYIAPGDCTGNNLGACSNHSAGTDCNNSKVCDGKGKCIVPPGGVSYWAFEGNTDDLWGTNTGALQDDAHNTSEGRCGQGIIFDGNTDYIDFGSDPSIQSMDDNFSVSLWFRAKECTQGINSYIFSRSMSYGFRICRYNDPNTIPDLGYLVFDDDYVNEITYNSGMDLTDQKWYHAALVFNNSQASLYLNGSLLDSQSFNDLGNRPGENTLAGAWTNIDGWFNGTIDEIKIYNRSLNSTEIQEIYQDDVDACPLAPPSGDVYYISLSGDDNDPGTLAEPWRTIGKANSALQAGDTVYIREGTYSETIRPSESGTAGNYITYARYGSEEVNITGVNAGVNLENRNYTVIDGIRILDVHYWVNLEQSHHNVIKNCYMGKADDWAGVWMYESDYHKILNNTFIGYCGPGSEQYDNSDLVYCYGSCHYNVIEGNYFEYGAHISLTVSGQYGISEYNVIRNNRVWNPWHTGIDIYPRADYSLVEGNIILDGGEKASENICGSDYDRTSARKYHAGIQLGSLNCIIRNNVMINNGWMEINSYPPQGTPPGPAADASDNRIYHNTFNKNYNGPSSDTFELVSGNVFKNNLLYEQVEHEIEMLMGSGSVNYFINNNILGGSVSVSPDGIWSGTINEDPLFVNENAVSDTNNKDFDPEYVHLQSNSPMIDAGAFLTNTTSLGSGTSISVEDAGYFYDGWGIEGEVGDLIQLDGQSTTARITNVDYNTNIITVNISLSWSSGQGVALAYSGSAPDIGAFEYGGVVPPPPPTGEVAYWKFEGDYQDQWAGGNDGTPAGDPQFITGRCGQGLMFDDASDFVEVVGFSIPNQTGERTIMTWVNITSKDTVWRLIIGDSAENTQPTNDGISLMYRDDIIRAYVYNESGNRCNSGDGVIILNNPQANTWYHFAIVHNNTDASVYSNGNFVTSLACTGSRLADFKNDGPFTMGGYSSTLRPFLGVIDEVKIYNKSLNASEIHDIYQYDVDNCPLAPPPSTGEVAYFEFEGNYLDSWNNNDGTPAGNPSFGAGQCGQGVELDAAEGDYVSVPSDNIHFEAPDHTLMAWVNFNDWAGSNTDVIFANSGIQWVGSLSLYRTSSDDMRFVVRDNSSTAERTVRDVQHDVSSLSGWHHVAAVISRQNPVAGPNYMDLYIDGSNSGNTNLSADSVWFPYTGDDLQIGASTETEYADGIIDEVKVFNRTLSQAEIIAEMDCP